VTFEQLIAQQRPHLERLVHSIARRNLLASSDIEDFRAAVERALERNDYELLRAFDGRSTWETYLHTVLLREFYLFQLSLWGDWRPSATARRMGPAAMLLEELVARDGFLLSDAVDWMRSTHRVDQPRHKLMHLAERLGLGRPLPRRIPLVVEAVPNGEMRHAVRDALLQLTADDRLLLELRFRDRQPLTRIAALLKVEVRRLQRRLEEVKSQIRERLIAQGFEAAAVEAFLSAADSDASGSDRKWWELVLARPSKEAER
jgi:DNA-directed RNA polymerase specialized sigma24 family protein